MTTTTSSRPHEEKLSHVMLSQDTHAYKQFVLFAVYQTIKANKRITLNQLKHILRVEMLMQPDVIEGAVSALHSKCLYSCVTMYQVKAGVKQDATNFHLDVKDSEKFATWLDEVVVEFPEFQAFKPPVYAERFGRTEVKGAAN